MSRLVPIAAPRVSAPARDMEGSLRTLFQVGAYLAAAITALVWLGLLSPTTGTISDHEERLRAIEAAIVDMKYSLKTVESLNSRIATVQTDVEAIRRSTRQIETTTEAAATRTEKPR